MNADANSDLATAAIHAIQCQTSRLRRAQRLRLGASAIALAFAGASTQTVVAQTPPPASGSDQEASREEIIVNGVPPAENIMPTQRSNSSIYGLDLNVMEIPRNTTMLSAEQLQAINIQDPRSFSYLTSSSYTDSAFGGPNVPRIRGQYGDILFNGMRSSFTSTGYGAPISFNSIETIDITKGPAGVIAGPGPGVGGSADFITKRPGLQTEAGDATFTFDSLGVRRWTFDYSAPVIPGELAWRVSYSGEDNDSYFYGHYIDQQALYAAVRWLPSDNYSIDFNTEAVVENYQENVGINRVNQSLIDNGTYLRGNPLHGPQLVGPFDPVTGQYLASPTPSGGGGVGAFLYAIKFPGGYNVGSPGNPYSPAFNILTMYRLGNPVQINDKITIDEVPGTSAHAFLYNAQVIQKYQFNDNISIENNTFFNYENRDNQANYYYADSAKGSYTIENRTNLDVKFELPISGGDDGLSFKNETNIGESVRYAHINYVGDLNNEPVGVYDLTGNPNNWYFSPSVQIDGDAFRYLSAQGRWQYGVPGRDTSNPAVTVDSDTWDIGFFLEHRVEFTPELSLMTGGRVDFVENHAQDPFTPLPGFGLNLPAAHTTAWYGLGNVNVSPVYKFAPWGSFYLTYDYTQNVSGSAGDGALGTYGQIPDKKILQQTSRLYEAGLKFDLLNKTLFINGAAFWQERLIPNGPSGYSDNLAKINGFEAEANYQPERHFFATASYTFLRTRLAQNPGFYNYPAMPGINVDGAGLFASWLPGQHFDDPGIPRHIFNFLGNYRFDSGIGLRLGVQVTGPFDMTASGWLNLASPFLPQSIVANGGYYQGPRIPWQYTINAAIYYDLDPYEFKFSIYNLTDQRNWQASNPFYGNDFLLRNDPIDFEFSMRAKF